jgi:hypothetical protein
MFSKAYTYSVPTFNTFLRYPNNIGFETSKTFIPMAKKKSPNNVWIRVVRFFLLGPRNGQLMVGYMYNRRSLRIKIQGFPNNCLD